MQVCILFRSDKSLSEKDWGFFSFFFAFVTVQVFFSSFPRLLVDLWKVYCDRLLISRSETNCVVKTSTKWAVIFQTSQKITSVIHKSGRKNFMLE